MGHHHFVRGVRNGVRLSLVFCATLIFLVSVVVGASSAQASVRLATAQDEATAPLAISRDGREVTFRPAAKDNLRICVEPSHERFGSRVCFTVEDVRVGRVGTR